MLPSPPMVPLRERRCARAAFTLLELLVVIAILGVLMALLLPAVQKVRESAARIKCANNLKQFGLALHGFHDTHSYIPAGMVTELDIQDSYHTGFVYLLPYIEQDNIHRLYNYDKQWYDPANYTAVGQQAPIFFCPSNRTSGTIDLTPFIRQWGAPMPPFIGCIDYALCKGARAQIAVTPDDIPIQTRGLFNISQADWTVGNTGQLQWFPTPQFRVRFLSITDGLSSTIAMGEAAGGNPYYVVADINNLSQPAVEPFINGPAVMDQGWAAASLGDSQHPWYAGIFGVTAQWGLPPDPMDEPMNRRPGMPSIIGLGASRRTDHLLSQDRISGFRSMHLIGCNFLFADGSVHFLPQSIDPAVYRALSTYAAGEVISGNDF
jgi:prepilin-type N-terminal cleavage/methylation domain-containing protein/prepilin-type processing-associated H-X9-DG protein